jgi:hypothetical protein
MLPGYYASITITITGNTYIYEEGLRSGQYGPYLTSTMFYYYRETGTITYADNLFIITRGLSNNMPYNHGTVKMAFVCNLFEATNVYPNDTQVMYFVGSEADEIRLTSNRFPYDIYDSYESFGLTGECGYYRKYGENPNPSSFSGVLGFHVNDVYGYGPWADIDDLVSAVTSNANYSALKSSASIAGVFTDAGLSNEVSGSTAITPFTKLYVSYADAVTLDVIIP